VSERTSSPSLLAMGTSSISMRKAFRVQVRARAGALTAYGTPLLAILQMPSKLGASIPFHFQVNIRSVCAGVRRRKG
jgi:hypothetical protein